MIAAAATAYTCYTWTSGISERLNDWYDSLFLSSRNQEVDPTCWVISCATLWDILCLGMSVAIAIFVGITLPLWQVALIFLAAAVLGAIVGYFYGGGNFTFCGDFLVDLTGCDCFSSLGDVDRLCGWNNEPVQADTVEEKPGGIYPT